MYPMELTAIAEQRRAELLRDAAPRRPRRRAGGRPAQWIRLGIGFATPRTRKPVCC